MKVDTRVELTKHVCLVAIDHRNIGLCHQTVQCLATRHIPVRDVHRATLQLLEKLTRE